MGTHRLPSHGGTHRPPQTLQGGKHQLLVLRLRKESIPTVLSDSQTKGGAEPISPWTDGHGAPVSLPPTDGHGDLDRRTRRSRQPPADSWTRGHPQPPADRRTRGHPQPPADRGIQPAAPAHGRRQEEPISGRTRRQTDPAPPAAGRTGEPRAGGPPRMPTETQPDSPVRQTGPAPRRQKDRRCRPSGGRRDPARPSQADVPGPRPGPPYPVPLQTTGSRRQTKGRRTDRRARWRRRQSARRGHGRGHGHGPGKPPARPGPAAGSPRPGPAAVVPRWLSETSPAPSGASCSLSEAPHLFFMDPSQPAAPARPKEVIRASCRPRVPRRAAREAAPSPGPLRWQLPSPAARVGRRLPLRHPSSPESRLPCKVKNHDFTINLKATTCAVNSCVRLEMNRPAPQSGGASGLLPRAGHRQPQSRRLRKGLRAPPGTDAGPAYPRGCAAPQERGGRTAAPGTGTGTGLSLGPTLPHRGATAAWPLENRRPPSPARDPARCLSAERLPSPVEAGLTAGAAAAGTLYCRNLRAGGRVPAGAYREYH